MARANSAWTGAALPAATRKLNLDDLVSHDSQLEESNHPAAHNDGDDVDSAEVAQDADDYRPPITTVSVYEWNDHYGDVPPHNEALKAHLFEDIAKEMTKTGEHMHNLEIAYTVSGKTAYPSFKNFEHAGLHPVMVENLQLCGYQSPTPVQQACIPPILHGEQVVATAQTGTGKTAAYLIPVFSRLMGKYSNLCAPRPNVGGVPADAVVRAEPLVVIVTPTRELCLQVSIQIPLYYHL